MHPTNQIIEIITKDTLMSIIAFLSILLMIFIFLLSRKSASENEIKVKLNYILITVNVILKKLKSLDNTHKCIFDKSSKHDVDSVLSEYITNTVDGDDGINIDVDMIDEVIKYLEKIKTKHIIDEKRM